MQSVTDVFDVLALLCGRVKMTFSQEGVVFFLPFPASRETVTSVIGQKPETVEDNVAVVSSRTGPILLSLSELQNEYSRLLGLLKNLRMEEQGQVDLIPNVHYRQVYEIMRMLRAAGFYIKPNGSWDQEGGGNRKIRFVPNDDGSVRLWLMRKHPTNGDVVQETPDSLSMDRVLELAPVVTINVGLDQESGGRRKMRPKNGAAQDGNRVDSLLKEVRRDLRSRGVEGLPLDWSLVPPPKSHKGAMFHKKRHDPRRDDRFHGED